VRTELLPEAATRKLADLEFSSLNALDDGRAANSRLQTVGSQLDDRTRERLIARRDQQTKRHQDLHLLISRIKKFVAGVPASKTLESCPVEEAKARDGETIAQAIARVRTEVAQCQLELIRSKNAPPPKSELKAAVREQVARLAQGAAPWLDPRGAKLINFGDPRASSTYVERETLWAFFCWLDPEKATAKISGLIDALPTPQGAMTTAEKAETVAALTVKLDELERVEESLIEAAALAQSEILRRPNASPAAVLGVRLTERPVEEEDSEGDEFEEEFDETADAEVVDEEAA
jgi:hypothetical protein